MKSTVNKKWPTVLVGLGLAIGACHAQTFTTIRSFGILSNITGFYPQSPLVQGPDGTLYGACSGGEGSVRGTIFKVQPDGSGFTALKWFDYSIGRGSPNGSMALSGSVLYGTTHFSGSSDEGTVFKMNTDGTGYTVLRNFTGTDGSYPSAGVILSEGVLYGTTWDGGTSRNGTVFRVNTDGTGYTVLHNFIGSDGEGPYAGLALAGSELYGTTGSGGSSGNGTVFRLNTNGTGYAVLKNFGGTDGSGPTATLLLSGNVLYGTTQYGGSSNAGTVFKLNTDGTGYTVLYGFGGSLDGEGPQAGLTLSGSVLYGTTTGGGSSGGGTVFQLNTDGTGYAVLYNFDVSPDSVALFAGLTLSSNVFYGTTTHGGSSGRGTLFTMTTDGTGYTVLKNFTFSDAASPVDLSVSGSVLYGTTSQGGSSGYGRLFKVNADNTAYTVLKDFTNSDGSPNGAVTLSGSVLYGTTSGSFFGQWGTVFAVNTDGTGYTNLYSLDGVNEGAGPQLGVISAGNTLYGTAFDGGSGGTGNAGTVFAVNADGTGFTTLYSFTGCYPCLINPDGMLPNAGLALSGNTLYGTTLAGGSSGFGTVFEVNTDGTGFTTLYNFTKRDPNTNTNSDGNGPSGGLIVSGNTLYGTAFTGGAGGEGTVFALNVDGSGFTVLHSFVPLSNGSPGTNRDGANPSAGLALSGTLLYGTTRVGGSAGGGTVFMMNTDGTGYRVLHNFTGGLDGANPGGLALSGNVLYGTTKGGGGSLSEGTLFKLDLSPRISLTIQSLGNTSASVVLSWPANATALTLQSTTNLASPIWTTVSVAPVIVNGQNTVTNPISGTQQFYRLSQ